ncbi:MAG: hypothetical protein RBT70_01250 [Alphaproteobacteria bacterium]|nr:hypothetical protein [Alphaproteobacteria bacterium]
MTISICKAPAPLSLVQQQLKKVCEELGLVYLDQDKMLRQGYNNLRTHRLPTAWSYSPSISCYGAIKLRSPIDSAAEDFSHSVAELCGIDVPQSKIWNGFWHNGTHPIFSPVIGEKPERLEQITYEKRCVQFAAPISAYISAYLPYHVLVGVWDVHDQNFIVTSDKYATAEVKTNPIVYCCDNAGMSLEKLDDFFPSKSRSFWQDMIFTNNHFHLDLDEVAKSANKIASLSKDTLAGAVDTLFKYKDAKIHFGMRHQIIDELSRRQDHIAAAYTSPTPCLNHLRKIFKCEPVTKPAAGLGS